MVKIDLIQRVKSFWVRENTFGVMANDNTIVAIGEYEEMRELCEKRNSENPFEEYISYEVVRISDDCSTLFREQK